MSRPTVDQWAMELAYVTAKRATCLRRSVGCVLLDQYNRVLSTGYNGVACGQSHCNELATTYGKKDPRGIDYHKVEISEQYINACPGAYAKSGTNLDGCLAIHAEQNALLQCDDVMAIRSCYCTASPCMTCVKLLLNTGCQRIVFLDEYPHTEAKTLWVNQQKDWIHYTGQLL